MEQPEGFKIKGQEGKVMHLKHTIYELKQAALAWWKALDKSMVQLGFTHLLSDFVTFTGYVYLYRLIYGLISGLLYESASGLAWGPHYAHYFAFYLLIDTS